MTNVIEKMLMQVHTGFRSRDLELAQSVLQLDAEVRYSLPRSLQAAPRNVFAARGPGQHQHLAHGSGL